MLFVSVIFSMEINRRYYSQSNLNLTSVFNKALSWIPENLPSILAYINMQSGIKSYFHVFSFYIFIYFFISFQYIFSLEVSYNEIHEWILFFFFLLFSPSSHWDDLAKGFVMLSCPLSQTVTASVLQQQVPPNLGQSCVCLDVSKSSASSTTLFLETITVK